jgi:predicted Zn-dependent protease
VSPPQELAEAALRAATADGCVVLVADHTAVNLRWAGNAMTTSGHLTELAMTVISVRERGGARAVGIAAGSVTTCAQAAELTHAADSASGTSKPIDDAPPLVEPDAPADDWSAEVPRTAPRDLEPVVAGLADAFERGRRRERSLFGFAEQRRTTQFLTTSTGVRRRFDQRDGRFELTGRDVLGQSVWHGQHTLDLGRLDVRAAVERVERDLDRALPHVQLPPGRYETILPPAAVADLMVFAYGQASARDALEGRTAFAAPEGGDRIGERVASLPLTLYSDPAEPGLE